MINGKPFVVKAKMDKRYRLWVVGDLHLYNRSCIEEEIDAMVKEIKEDPYALWIGVGDYADCISFDDPRFHPNEIAVDKRSAYFDGFAEEIVADVCEKFEPIKKKCLGLLEGNHEHKFDQKSQKNFHSALVADICETLKVRFLGYSGVFDLVFQQGKKKEVFKIYAHHGAGGSTTTGGKINKLKKMMIEVFDADIYCMGHCHEQMDLPMVYLHQKDGKICERKKMGVITGSYLATYRAGSTSYGEIAMYSPVSIGSIAVTIVPGTRRLGTEKR